VWIVLLKRCLKVVISLFYYLFILGSSEAIGAISGKPCRRLIVLVYHGITAHQREAFSRQMDMLLQAGCPVSLDRQVFPGKPRSLLSVTFDDGHANLITNALPTLAARGIPATIFVVSGNLGHPPRWDMCQEWPYRTEALMTAAELCSLAGHLVTVGSHTVSHPDLASLPEGQAQWELAESKRVLEAILGRPVVLFAFPYGSYTARLAELARQEGYRQAFTTEPQIASPDRPQYLVGRLEGRLDDWKLEFGLKIRGGYEWEKPLRSLMTCPPKTDPHVKLE
jgi:peptidoglycan/xylan/chitin deacetylase (PgdA/CDA1 family)